MRNAPVTSSELLLFDRFHIFETSNFTHQSPHGFIQYMDLKYLCVLPRGLCRLSQATHRLPFSWQTKTILVNLIFRGGGTVWTLSVLLLPSLSVNSRIPGTLSRCVSQVYSFQGHLNSDFSCAVKKYLTKELQEEFVLAFEAVWSYEEVGAGARGSLSHCILRRDGESSPAMTVLSALSPFPSGPPPPRGGTLCLQAVSSHLP